MAAHTIMARLYQRDWKANEEEIMSSYYFITLICPHLWNLAAGSVFALVAKINVQRGACCNDGQVHGRNGITRSLGTNDSHVDRVRG